MRLGITTIVCALLVAGCSADNQSASPATPTPVAPDQAPDEFARVIASSNVDAKRYAYPVASGGKTDDSQNWVDLFMPKGNHKPGSVPLVVLIHGGSWSTEYSLSIATAVARDLTVRGAVVWNLEYRRVESRAGAGDGTGGGWPQTGRDVVAALTALDGPVAEALALAGIAVNKRNVAVVGHSAGGQLATWAVAQLGARTEKTRITTVVAQSAVLDLTVEDVRTKRSVRGLMGQPYSEAPRRYEDASPAQAPVHDALVEVLHTVDDEAVAVELSRHYVEQVTARGQRATLTEIPGDHAAFLDVRSPAHRATLRALGL